MVHLTPDSRLLVSLVKQEQAYAAQLHSLLNASGTSLSALAVYASSSPPTVSPVLNGVAGAFSGADEAFRTYGEALNDWIDQLGRIKQREDDVANIGRDREILVTRLLKVSQKSKSPPPSLLHAPHDSSSSTSLPMFNSKINTAQTELRACESRLAETERELESVRIHAIKQGLALRCSALIQCGQVWSEMGRRALEMLNELGGTHLPSNGHATEFFKPLPDPTHDRDHDSVLSSLTPSQSASQIGGVTPLPVPFPPGKSYRLDIPPPHLVSDTNVIPQTSGADASSSSEDEGPVEVFENPRFKPAPSLNRSKNTWVPPQTLGRYSPLTFTSAGSDLGSSSKLKHKEKKRTGLFGNIAALFRTSMTPKNETQYGGSWSTRTGRNIRNAKTDGEHSSDEEGAQTWSGTLRKSKGRVAASAFDRNVPTCADDGDDAGRRFDSGISATTLRRKGSGKLSRNSTIRSTVSEPSQPPRLRAHSLSTISSGPVTPNGITRPHSRTASMNGTRGRTSSGTDIASSQIRKQPWSDGESLTRIVESPSIRDPSSRLEVVCAPGSALPRLPLLVHPPPPLAVPSSVPSSPVISKTAAPKRASMPVPTITTPGLLVSPAPSGAPEKKPLRSAMRKSPSPSASPNVRAAADGDQSPAIAPLSLPAPPSLSPRPRPVSLSRPEIPSTIIESPRQSYASTKADDTASISSYETGHENMDDEVGTETDQHTYTRPPPPPPNSEKAVLTSSQGPTSHGTDLADKHELSSVTSTDTAPTRRKSVRMSSLPPQVSATPPALEEYNDVDHAPSSNQSRSDTSPEWRTRIPTYGAALSWDDSSSEDEMYQAARKALTLANQRSKKKAKR